MFEDSVQYSIDAAKEKIVLLKGNFLKYFILSMLAGSFVGVGVMFAYGASAPFLLADSPSTKIVAGVAFAASLMLLTFSGAELFTGNNMTMAFASFSKDVKWTDTFYLWIVNYLGNFAGAIVFTGFLLLSGVLYKSPFLDSFLYGASGKMNLPASEMFIRGILCNYIVCLTVWVTKKVQNEAARAILIVFFMCSFVVAGFEHSVANMTLLTSSLFLPHAENISTALMFKNLFFVTAGNIIGGALFVALPYFYVARGKMKS